MKVLGTSKLAGAAGLLTLVVAAACATSSPKPVSPRAEAKPHAAKLAAEPIQTHTVTVSGPIVSACHIKLDGYKEAAGERSPTFAFDDSQLSAADRALLGKVAECMTNGPLAGKSIALIGRADPRGEVEYNMSLGAHRSSSVARYLESKGVSKKHLSETSRGELDATGTDEASWARDRRVDLLLL
ncbi:MAG TPA: OmpA family protein [Polyangiaceae bacterium]|nr:OmpA family protein [Polyangiaceae bacterium]